MPIQTKTPARKPSWRDVLAIHPACDLFPLMTPAELFELGEDIKKNGLKLPIAITGDSQLLDGRGRLDGMEAAGVEFKIRRTTNGGQVHIDIVGGDLSFPGIVTSDPYAYVISVNIRRRHLTAEKKRELIAKLIKAQPEKPDLQLAKTVKVSPTTVGTVRREMEAKGDVSKLETRTDTKGRQQPARKAAKKKPAPSEPIKPVAAQEAKLTLATTAAQCAVCLEQKSAIFVCGDCLSIYFQIREATPPPDDDDGLGIPDFLDRNKQTGAAL